MNITDKELLAICNLSNLKMEFANIIKKKETIHIIYSLLEKEVKSIEKNDLSTRAFRKEKYKNGITDHSFNI